MAAALLLFTAIVAGVVLVTARPAPSPHRTPPTTEPRPAPAADRLARARGHARQGHFRLALAELDAALTGLESCGPGTPGHALLTQQRAELALLADLLAEPLEDLVAQAAALPAAEWRAEFDRRYRGRAIVLDTSLEPAGGGAWRTGYLAAVGGEAVTLDLDGVDALRPVPREPGRRVVLGGRLDDIRRERPGLWVARFQPGGVLFTEGEALAACCPALGDPATTETLRAQRLLQSLPE